MEGRFEGNNNSDLRGEGLFKGNLAKSGHHQFGSAVKERNENLKTEPWRPLNEDRRQIGLDDKK